MVVVFVLHNNSVPKRWLGVFESSFVSNDRNSRLNINRHFSLLNVNAAGACGYDFPCDGGRLVRAYLRRRRGTI